MDKLKLPINNIKSSTQSVNVSDSLLKEVARTLTKQIDQEFFERKYAPIKEVLKIVAMGTFLAGAIVMPNLPLALKPFLKREKEYEVWKRFNIPYLKRTLERLEKQKLVEFGEEAGMQIIKITANGKRKVLKFAIDELAVEKPKIWDGKWTLISYDIPEPLKDARKIFQEYLKAWGFYPLHESVFLHAWPCQKQIEFLREYLGIAKNVRIFKVSSIENDRHFRDFFGV